MSEAKTDFLKEDPAIVNQEWCVISIISPKDRVTTKTLHYVNNFMVSDINQMIVAQGTQMVKKLNARYTSQVIDEIETLKNSLNEDDRRVYALFQKSMQNLVVNEDEFLDECRREYQISDEEIKNRYDVYLSSNRDTLDSEFDSIHGNIVSVRGIKNRGNYARFADAEKRAQFVRGLEPAVHVFVAPVGKWCPVDFDADEIQDQEYMSSELNSLMSAYHENMNDKNVHFEQRKQEMVSNNYQKMTVKERLQAKLAARKTGHK